MARMSALMRIPEYRVYRYALTRCFNKNCKEYANYGGRGITMCSAWLDDPMAFLRDMGPRPTPKHQIDRIDNNGNYEPANCRWATVFEQANNKRNNRLLTVGSTTRTIHEWAVVSGMPVERIRQRILRLGWTHEAAVTVPSYESNRKISEIEWDAIKARCAAGESQASIARSAGVKPHVIARIVSGRGGIKTRKPSLPVSV